MSVANGTAAATLAQVNMAQALIPQSIPKKKVYFEGSSKVGYRIPRIDVLLGQMAEQTRHIEMGGSPTGFHMLTGDQAVEVLGKYNPMYAGRPKKITLLMLDAAAGRVKARYGILPTGLFYTLPLLVGVRSTGMRLSAAGLMLLDYWAGKFPRFEAFVNAYVTKKARQQIMCDCYDLAMGYEPAWFSNEAKKNKQYQLKADSRELKRLKKEQEMNSVLQKQHAALIQQQMAHQYAQGLNGYNGIGYGSNWTQNYSPTHSHSVNDPGHGMGSGIYYPSATGGLGMYNPTAVKKTTGGV